MKIQNKISNCIYGTMMLLPMVAVLSSCAYSIFNKNAVSDVSNVVTFDTNDPVDKDNFLTDYVYKLNLTQVDFPSWATIGYCDYLYIETNDTFEFYNKDLQFNIRTSNNIPSIRTMIGSPVYTTWGSSSIRINNCYVVFNAIYDYSYYYLFEQSDITTFNTNVLTVIDNRNTFYYATEKVSNDNLFAWSKNTPYYNAFNGFTTFFGLDQDFYPMMLSYWVTISLVMFGFEVITFMITFARNCIHKFEDKAGGF